ncbi:rho guanine nucleotide exchange factor 12 [Trichonephila clavata]|uniref:Rho guanine nucleotide exchange factor 12 n=1 Tax=Trichonephila clavata TaxID=2740835 RepID=A0A8X6G324_TRICU|nr:rho guanine nucleotide exchange factor 12 [Trichonephila clavata]
MDLTPTGLTDKSRIISRNDSNLHKDDSSILSSDVTDSKDPMVQRCVIIQKDEKGYGLTVSGDNPVFVQSVKEDGAAARAGVQQGDRIIKVNGTLVTQSNHQEVVELIKSGSYVALTLLGKPPGHAKSSLSPQHSFLITGNSTSMNILNSSKSDASDRITGPQPVDPEKQQQLTNSRIHTIRKMLEKEIVYLENLRAEFSKTPSEKMRSEVNGAVKRVKTLEEQLVNLTGVPHEHIITRSPKSPTSGRHNHDRESHRSISFPAHGSHNRPLTHQISAPVLPANQASPSSPDSSDSKYQVILSPCTETQDKKASSPDSQKQPISTSLENIVKHLNPRTTTWPQHTHTRQSSSPETLRGIESLKCQKSNGCTRAESLYRSPSAVSPYFGSFRSFTSNLEKSSHPTPITGQCDNAIESPVPSPPGTPPEPVESRKSGGGESLEGEELVSHEESSTPPDSSLDEYNLQPVVSKLNQNPNIICMEDDDFSSDTEMGHLEDHGPFNGLWKLVRNPAHLSVFLHYLMSNSDPSSLFFYLISEMFEQGTGKDMKKWAYEIHSSFLVPGAPLKVSLVDETILHEIDEVLLNHIDKEETLRGVFRKARRKAKEELNDFLAEFRNKRTMGLANIFGPPDFQLEEAMQDKNKELKVIEQLLGPYFDNYSEEMEGMDDRSVAKIYALATVLKQFGVKNAQLLSVIEKCPTFVGKERSFITSLLQRNKKVIFMQGHHFVSEHYYSVTYCNHCQLIIWGIGYQGYQCQNCEMNIHKACIKVVEEHCIGALRNKKETKKDSKEKMKKDRKSGLMEQSKAFIAKTRKTSQPVPSAIEKAKRLNEEMNADNGLGSEHHHSRSDSAGRGIDHLKEPSDIVFQNMLNLSESLEKSNSNKKNASSIGRSESFRQTRESKPSFRKRSDPNIPRSKSDVDVDDKHGLNESRSSSNSSLSNRSLDSPSNSSEMVHRTPTSVSADSVPPNFAPSCGLTSSGGHMTGNNQSTEDSDLEADADPPKWQENVDWDVLKVMKPKEKKRQDVINELFHTEKTHVRNLKVLDQVFYKPLLQEQLLPLDFLNLLFPNLEEMLEIHSTFNNKMKARRKLEPVIGDIGQLMLEMFDGAAGEHLKHAAATYCKNQSIALESLKHRQKKDQKLAQSLSDAETNNLCRRLQLKDIIASGFQRLTKYPLLLENIAKYTPPNTQELTDLQRAVDCSKEILVHVDSAIKEAENRHRLLDIQKKMDKSSFEKVEHPVVQSFKNLDLTNHKLLYEGPLLWRHSKQKHIEMHIVLMEDILILFQKQDDKYILKFHNTILTSGREDTKVMHSPILRVQNIFSRENATDKRTFFIVSSSEMHAIYEFVAATASEKKIWCNYIDKTAQELKQKLRNMAKSNQEASHPVPEPTLPTEPPQENTETETKPKEPEPTTETTEESKTHPPTAPESNLPPSEPEEPPPNVPPDETPQRAKQVGHDEDANESGGTSRPHKRLEHIEILEITEGPQLIEPSEVIVSSGAICETAEPVLTPFEKLRRKDLEISKAIEEKEIITAEILQIPLEEFKTPQEIQEDTKDMTALDLITVAVQQGNKLSSFLNESLTLEETPPIIDSEPSEDSAKSSLPEKASSYTPFCRLKGSSLQSLLPVSKILNQSLAQLVVIVSNMEEERKQLRKELANYQEQIHQLHEAHRHCTTQSQSPSMHSRPSSFVSVASTASDGMSEFFESQHLFSVLENSEETTSASPIPREIIIPESSSPVKEDNLSTERRTFEKVSVSDNRTCDHSIDASNCDVQNFATAANTSESCPVEDATDSESECRTMNEEHTVDPVYL